MPNKSDDKILELARKRMDMAISAYSDSRDAEQDDLKFYAGSPNNNWQWPADAVTSRSAVQGQTINSRPTLTINKLPQHVKQVTNDQRQNRPSGKVIPVDDQADVEVAEIFDGMVRHIEYISDADVAYDTACENQVIYGEGFVRLVTEYCDDSSFDQEIKIKRVRNSFSVYMDPAMQDPCGADAEWAFINQDVLKTEFEKMWPGAQPISILEQWGPGDQSLQAWIMEDMVRIAEYFYVDYEKRTLNLYVGNKTAYEGSPQDIVNKASGLEPIRSRSVNVKKIKWCKTNGYEILEKGDWAGNYIPVVRIIGNEFEVEGTLHISGLVRNAKDAQRMYNYWTSQEAEMLALAPKSPFIGYAGQFEGFETQWKNANIIPYPYLEVNPEATDGQGNMLPLPQRSAPPLPQTAIIQAKMGSSDDIKATTGQYDSSLGATSNERSGKAILARERQTDVGTYHYVDNLARGVRYVTRQIIDLIPKIYDTERIARIMGVDNDVDMVKINPNQPEAVKKITDQQGIVVEKIYNPGVGKYDVCVTTGPSYMTKRQEAMESMGQLLQGNPELWQVAGDLFIKNMDWPGAQEMAKRFRKTIDPKLLSNGDESPELQAAQQQIEAMGAEMENMYKMLQSVQNSMENRDISVKENDSRIKEFEATIKAYEAETKRLSTLQPDLSKEQIQDVVLGTVHGMIDSGDLTSGNFESAEYESTEYESPESQI